MFLRAFLSDVKSPFHDPQEGRWSDATERNRSEEVISRGLPLGEDDERHLPEVGLELTEGLADERLGGDIGGQQFLVDVHGGPYCLRWLRVEKLQRVRTSRGAQT